MNSTVRDQISSRRAFTLLELIGVLTIISILLATAAPLTIQLIQSQRQASDDAYLPTIAEALKRGILREQLFPSDDAASPNQVNIDAWWRLAARHGAGSENDIRFPQGSAIGLSGNPRRLFLAESSWAGQTFYETTEGGTSWLADVNDPRELRMLLLSTTNPDLPLPTALTAQQFEAFWSNWSVGSNGEPVIGALVDYGLSGVSWAGRAAELNLERIDMRDWLCRLVIENRRHINRQFDTNGNLLKEFNIALGSYLTDPLPSVGIYNLNGARASLKLGAVLSTGPVDQVTVDGFYLVQPGRPINEEAPAGFVISGQQLDLNDDPISSRQEFEVYSNLDADSTRAQLALINPLNSGIVLPLDGWDNSDDPIQDRYFLKTQELLLEEPWSGEEIGIFIIKENYSTLRFDGLAWMN
jgi:prepilin-type N-terminal cleavage/methylation domain-containing protein